MRDIDISLILQFDPDAVGQEHRSGCLSLLHLGTLSQKPTLCLTGSLQSRDPNVPCAAFDATKKLLARGLLTDQIPSILTAASYSSMSESHEVRYSVACLLRIFDSM